MIPVIQTISTTANITVMDPLWWSLILGTSLGGCLTPVGSPSIVVALSIIEEQGDHITMKEFFKVSATTTLMYLGLATVFILAIWGGFAPIIIPITLIGVGLIGGLALLSWVRKKSLNPTASDGWKRIGTSIDKTTQWFKRITKRTSPDTPSEKPQESKRKPSQKKLTEDDG
jgi:Na+/H+ antiporter NhaD/arsenite permease-like protein